MTEYELGGVRFILHQGEVYCRYRDVYEAEETDEEEEIKPAEQRPAKASGGSQRAPRKCSNCGEPGHNAKTCPREGNPGGASVDIPKEDNQQSPVPQKRLSAREELEAAIRDLVAEGLSFDEIQLTYPGMSSDVLREIYDRFAD